MIEIFHKGCNRVLKVEDLLREKCSACGQCFKFEDVACVRTLEPSKITERDVYTSKFIKLTQEMINLARGAKTDDYGETWKRLGIMGLYVKIFIKEGRLNELIWNKKVAGDVSVKEESIKDTLLDMANYCVYAAIALEENNIYGETAIKEHLMNMRCIIDERMGDIF